jgi:septal ring factor EnvC (AmiA/AmiB activator)
MSDKRGNDRQYKACIDRYMQDCRQIESQQDEIQRELNKLNELREESFFDGKHVHSRLEQIAREGEPSSLHELQSIQNQLADDFAQLSQEIASCREEKERQMAQLAAEREEREHLYRAEIRKLDIS